MSNVPPPRRTLRTHRATGSTDENALRTKIPAPGLPQAKPVARSRLAESSTVAPRAKAQGSSSAATATKVIPAQKRKRGAFVEVVNSDKVTDDGIPSGPSKKGPVAALDEKRKLRAVCEEPDMMAVEPPPAAVQRPVVAAKPARGVSRIPSQRRTRTVSAEEVADAQPSAKKKQRTSPEPAPHVPLPVVVEMTSPRVTACRWTDIDADDAEDPGSVAEYAVDIFQHMLTIELTTLPKPTYVHTQKEFTPHARNVLVDWLVELHARFRMLSETLYLTINVMDRFLSTRAIRISKAQLVGAVALLVAAKYEESMVPSIDDLVIQTGSQYTREEILKAEAYMLKTLAYDLNTPTPVAFLRRVNKANEGEIQAYTLSKYLMEIGCVEIELIGVRPSLLAASALWLARLVLDQEDWTPTLEHYSTYGERAIVPIANVMLNYTLQSVSQHPSFFKKYASKRYLKASVYMQAWATQSWAKDTIVKLAEELPRIKAEIYEARRQHEVVELEAAEQVEA